MAAERAPRRITRELLFGAFLGPQRAAEDPTSFDRIIAAVESETRSAGEVLYREGDPAKHVHFMTEGRVRLSRAGAADWVYEGWWVIGTADVLIDRPRARTVTVETDTRFFRMPAALWFAANRDQPDALLLAVTGFAQGTSRLRTELAPDGGFASPAASATWPDVSTLSGRAALLDALPQLTGQRVQTKMELARIAERTSHAEGDTISRPGSGPARLFVVTRGLVELTREAPAVSGRFGPGAVVGGLIFAGEGRHDWTARAIEPSEVLSFAVDDLFDLLDDRLDGMRALMTAAAIEREKVCEELASRRGELLLT